MADDDIPVVDRSLIDIQNAMTKWFHIFRCFEHQKSANNLSEHARIQSTEWCIVWTLKMLQIQSQCLFVLSVVDHRSENGSNWNCILFVIENSFKNGRCTVNVVEGRILLNQCGGDQSVRFQRPLKLHQNDMIRNETCSFSENLNIFDSLRKWRSLNLGMSGLIWCSSSTLSVLEMRVQIDREHSVWFTLSIPYCFIHRRVWRQNVIPSASSMTTQHFKSNE